MEKAACEMNMEITLAPPEVCSTGKLILSKKEVFKEVQVILLPKSVVAMKSMKKLLCYNLMPNLLRGDYTLLLSNFLLDIIF